jgi:hypothetical protein
MSTHRLFTVAVWRGKGCYAVQINISLTHSFTSNDFMEIMTYATTMSISHGQTPTYLRK